MANLPLISFNTGEVSPLIDVRSDVEKYASSCRILENMLPLIYGPAERRPGTEYIATAKSSPEGVRLIPFIYSATIAYMVEFGDLYARFYFDGGRVYGADGTTILEIVTPYLVADLPQLQFKQSADVMWIVHPSYAPRKLSRTSATAFALDEITFTKGPFLERNDIAVEDDVTLTASVITVGSTGTLTASAAIDPSGFQVGHIGSIWKLTHPRVNTTVSITKTGTSTGTSTALVVEGNFTFNIFTPSWTGTVKLERNEDSAGWETYRTYISTGNRTVQLTGTENYDNVQYRINVSAMTSGTVTADLTVNASTQCGVVRINSIASSTVANIIVLSAVASTDATKRWAEGAWSGVRGYPISFTFFEERAVYAGTTNNPRRVWLSESGEFEDFESGTKAADAFELDIPTSNSIRWIASLDALMVGASGDEWRIRATSIDAALTPTNFNIRQQTVRGCRDIQALEVNEAVLFVDFVGRKMRELTYSDDKQKFVSPDLTALAEHITENGITSHAHQRNPDSIVWSTLGDGTLLSMTYEREQNVVAWARHLVGLTQVDSTEVDSTTELTQYPVLQELTADEIPSIPDEPEVTDGIVEVANSTQLQAITGSGNYLLSDNIDLSGVSWTPITSFTGILDGNGKTISNLTISAAATDDQGLFGAIDSGAEIHNLTLSNCSVTGRDRCGILVGDMTTATGTTIKDITISDCTLVGDDSLGCLVGRILSSNGTNIWNCDVTDSTITSAAGDGIGMLIGYLLGGASTSNNNIVNCSSTGGSITLTTSADNVGGLIGYMDGAGGATREGSVHTCYSTTPILITDDADVVGGFVGYVDYWDITTCYSTGDITITLEQDGISSYSIGGFMGDNSCHHDFTNCYSTSNITVAPLGRSCNIEDVGGFFGTLDADDAHVLRCYSTGNITFTATVANVERIGGFTGGIQAVSGTTDGLIERCWSTGDITFGTITSVAANYGAIGGFAGGIQDKSSHDNTIRNCYSWGSVIVNTSNPVGTSFGGFLGAHEGTTATSSATITNCYAAQTNVATGSGLTAQLATSTRTGGFLGYESSLADIDETELFYDSETSGTSTSVIGTANATPWMMTKSNYEDADWDFDDIWELGTVTNYVQMDATGTVESVAVIPGEDEDEVWIAVLRLINGGTARYIERMKPRDFGDQEDAFFVDCGLSYNGTATDTFSGLDHLEGETVAVLGDGAVFPEQTVASGSITITDEVEKAHVGLPFRYRLKPMRLDVSSPVGTTHGSIKTVPELVISFIDTLNARYGDGTDTYDIDWREEEEYTTPPALFTGDKVLSFDGGFTIDDPIIISGQDPLPATVRAIIPRTEKTGR